MRPTHVPWAPNVHRGFAILALFGLCLWWILTTGPTSGVLPMMGTAAFATWLGTLGLIHITGRSALWLRVPAVAAVLAAMAWFGMFAVGPVNSARDGWLILIVMATPAFVPLLFGIAHGVASTGGDAQRYQRAGWVAVALSAVAGGVFLVLAIGASGMGGG